MTDVRAHPYKTLLAKVNAVLYEEWDPIASGGLPRDEYESYAVRIVSMLVAEATDKDVTLYLLTVGAPLTDQKEEHAARVTEVVRHLMEFQEEARAIAP
jgi:hypothetical protein